MWGFLKDDIFWLVLKLEISYNRVIIICWRILVSVRGFFFWRLVYFCMVKYLNCHNSSFALRYLFFTVNGKATNVTYPLLSMCHLVRMYREYTSSLHIENIHPHSMQFLAGVLPAKRIPLLGATEMHSES